MGNVFWNVTANGDWDDAANWLPETAPGVGDDAVLGVTGFAITESYVVSVTASIDVGAIAITDSGAELYTGAGVVTSVADDVTNAGDIELQNGGQLAISGNLSNTTGATGTAIIDVDTNSSGGSSLSVTGTFSNTGRFSVGNGNLTTGTLISVGALQNTGSISLSGDSSLGNTERAVLDVLSAATSTWTGTLALYGQSLLEFASGSIGAIADDAEIYLGSADAYINDAGGADDSALSGLASNAGDLQLQDGASVALSGALTNTGAIYLDTNTDYGLDPNGGSTLDITGALTNDDKLVVGNSGMAANALVTAASLVNTGSISLVGNVAKGIESTLDIAGAAPTTLTGFYDLGGRDSHGGDSLVEFGSGKILSIAANAEVYLANPTSFIADADDTSHDSALIDLASNAGDLELQDAAAPLNLAGGLTNTGTINLDTNTDYGLDPNGGDSLTIAGALTNTGLVNTNDGSITIGNAGLGAASTVTADSIDNTGAIRIVGDVAKGVEATLDITGAAPTTLTGFYDLGGRDSHAGDSLLEFGSGQISSIAAGATLYLANPTSFVADADDLTHDSALKGLTSNSGDLDLEDAAAPLTITGDLVNTSTGNINLDTNSDYGLDPNGGSELTIDGTLTNDDTVYIGNGGLGAQSLITVGALVNTGTLTLYGGKAEAVMDVLSAAPTTWTGTLNLNVGTVLNDPSGPAEIMFASGSIQTIATGASLYVWGQAYVADAATPNTNSALDDLASIVGTLSIDFGATVSIAGDLDVTGFLSVDEHQFDGFNNSGGSTLKVAGTLTNSATVTLGNGVLSGPAVLTVGALDNTSAGTINIETSSTYSATFTVESAAPSVWVGTLNVSGEGSIIFSSGSIQSIADDASITLETSAGFIADADDTTANGALSGLQSIAGSLSIGYGAKVTTDGGLDNSGTLGIDDRNGSGNSKLTVQGALTNSGTLNIGSYDTEGDATVDVESLDDTATGTINLKGGGADDAATLSVAAAAPTVWTGTLNLDTGTVLGNPSGPASLVFSSGSIQSIAANSSITIFAADAYVADADDLDSNSALSGLNSVSGSFYLDFGASASLTGDLDNSGTMGVDNQVFDGFDNSGGSTLHIAGTFINSGFINVGNYIDTATTTFTAAAWDNQKGATANINGSSTAQADVTITGALDNAGAFNPGNGYNIIVGSVDNTGTMNLTGSAGEVNNFQSLGVTSNDDEMTIAAYNIFGSEGAFTDAGALKLGGSLDADDGVHVESTGTLTMQGGEIIAPASQNVTVDAGATASGYGIVGPAIVNNGAITSSGGLLTLSGSVSGGGTLGIGKGSELELGGATTEAVSFDDNVGTLKLDQPASFTGSISGLVEDDVIDLAGVQATSAVVNGTTLTVTAGAQTYSYQVSGPGLAGNTFAIEDDQHGGTNLVLGPPGPTISGPTSQTAYLGWPTVLGPLTINDTGPGNGSLTVTITAQTGTLSGVDMDGNPLTGSGGDKLTLTGDVADINTMLASVLYNGPSAGASDNIQVVATDSSNATTAQTIAVTTDTVPYTNAALNFPLAVLIEDLYTTIGGISVDDPFAQATGTPLAFVQASTGPSELVGGSGGTLTGQGTDLVTVTGTVDQINSYFSDGDAQDYEAAQGIVAQLVEAIGDADLGYLNGVISKIFQIQQQINATPVGFSRTVLIREYQALIKQLTSEGAESIANAIVSQEAQILEQAGFNLEEAAAGYAEIIRGLGAGLPHFVTFAGTEFQFDAVGEFVLADVKQSGDSFQVQVRLQAIQGSSSASEITEVAVEVGDKRVTFGVDRQSVVQVDGSAFSLNPAAPTQLGDGSVSQQGANTYEVTWNTGEQLTVVDCGAYLSVSIDIGNMADGSGVQGLLGPDGAQADDFQLADGAILPQPLSSSELYGAFADAWRVTQATSLFDYAAGQSTATFTNTNFPSASLTLDDLLTSLPSSVVTAAKQAVAATGITDPGAVAAMEYDYLVSGGSATVLASDADAFQGITTTVAPTDDSSAPPAVLGIFAPVSAVQQSQGGPTDVTFEVYLTAPETTATTVDYAVVDSGDDDFSAAAFGGALPTGAISIAAGQTSATITIAVPQSALGTIPSKDLALQITSPGDDVPVFSSTAVQAVTQASATAPAASAQADPELAYLGDIGTFTRSGDDYTLNLGDIQYGEKIPTLLFSVANANSSPGDSLAGSFTWETVAGYENAVNGDDDSGAGLTNPVAAGSSDQALTVTTIQNKFGAQNDVITFTPVDTNASGYSEQLSPITLTITDTLEVPTAIYSQAFGDVHIETYNGVTYNFQAAGEFTLAKSELADDSFDIQIRLQPYTTSSSVTYITQAAISLGADDITFDTGGGLQAIAVRDNGALTTLSMSDPTLTFAGGTITEISAAMYKVVWSTGETMTVTEGDSLLTNGSRYLNISDTAPNIPNSVIGLQTGDNLPSTTCDLYGEYADAWRVTQASSLFYYTGDQTTQTFTVPGFPSNQISLADIPASVLAQAQAAVAAAGITDPTLQQQAELDYLATGSIESVNASANVNQQITDTTAAAITQCTTPATAIGVMADAAEVTEAENGPTELTFTAYLTGVEDDNTTVDYSVTEPDASIFGGQAPSGSVVIAAGQTEAQFTVDLPQGALGLTPFQQVQVQVSSPDAAVTVFAPTASTQVDNYQAVAGAPAQAALAYLGNDGTFTFDDVTNTYTLNLGGVTQNSALVAADFAVVNTATGAADSLSGTFSAPTGEGFTVTGDTLPSALRPGEAYEGLYTSINTADLGSNTMSLTFDPTDVNGAGYSAALAPIKLDIVDTVVPVAKPQINTPTTIIFPAVHVGATESQHVSVSNTAGAGAANLDVSLSASDDATASGAVTGLAPGATDASDLTVGLNTSTAGALSGAVTESFTSDGGGGNTSPIAEESPYIDIFGSVYRLADPSLSLGALTVHVGDPGSQTITISNLDIDDGYSENLIATVVGTTGAVKVSQSTTGDIKPLDDATIGVNFSTTAAGQIGSVTLDLKSDGAGIDGLGETDLGDVTIPIVVTSGPVPAAAEFEEISGGGAFSQKGAAYTLNLGTISSATTVSLGVLNSASAPSDALSGSFSFSGNDDEFVNSGFAAFSNVASGQADTVPTVTLNALTVGTFSETITLHPTDAATDDALPVETLTISGTVATATAAPTLRAPSTLALSAGVAGAVTGVSVDDSNAGVSLTVTASDTAGLLPANTSGSGGGGTITGAGTTSLSITGSLAQVDADLATLSDIESAGGTDTIQINADDSLGGKATPASIAVTTAAASVVETVTINPVDGDNVINNAEANAASGVALSGSVSGVAANSTFNVSVVDGSFSKTYLATVDAAGAGWTATMPESDAVALPNGAATVTAALSPSVSASETVTVAETPPTVTIAPVDGNNVINNAEANATGGVALSGSVSGLAAGATFTVSVADGSFSGGYTATVNAAGTGWTATLPEAAAITLPNGTATITTQVTDAYGNVSAPATDSVTVAETPPTVTISPVDGNNVINNAEANASGGVKLSGTVSGLAAGATFSVSVNQTDPFSKTYTATVDAAGTGWTATIPESDAATLTDGTATITAQVTDPYGNISATATDAVTVAVTAPTVTINQVEGDDVLTQAEASASGGVPLSGTSTGLAAGATFLVTVTDGSASHSYTATVSAGGAWTATIPSADATSLAQGEASVTAQATDAYGNVSPTATQSFAVQTSGTAHGDVHLATFDGVHYDFQATGEFILAESTNAAHPFEVQIQASPWANATSVTTEVAAQVGDEAVVLGLNGSIEINGQFKAGSQINLDGGVYYRLSRNDEEIVWNSGETLSVDKDPGGYFDVTMTLPTTDGANSVEGLLGRNAGWDSEFSLPSGTVVGQLMDADELTGFYADAWRVTEADTLFSGDPTAPAVATMDDAAPTLSSGLSATRTNFSNGGYEIATTGIVGEPYDGSDVFYGVGGGIETAVFTSGGSAYAVENWNGDGSVRNSTLLGAAGAPFGSSSSIDLEAFSPQASLAYQEDASGLFGVLTVSGAGESLSLKLAGNYTASEFSISSDGQSAAQIKFNAA